VFAAICYPRSGRVLVLLLTIVAYALVLIAGRGDWVAPFVVRALVQVALALLAGFLSNVLVGARREADHRAELLATVAVAARGIPMLREAGFAAVLAAPVWADGRLAAVLVGGTCTPRVIPAEEIEAMELLAAQAGAALVNAERFERLAELDRLKQDFVSTVSHELRTPLTVIQGLGKTLQQRWDQLEDGLRLELLQRLNENGDSLSSTITSLLDFSR